MTVKQKADHVHPQDPIRKIVQDIMSDADGNIIISIFGHAIITQEFLEAMQNNGYRLDRIFNGVVTHNIPENPNDILDTTQERPTVPLFIETTLRFEDTKYSPDLETSCKMCGKHGEVTEDQQEKNENAVVQDELSS